MDLDSFYRASVEGWMGAIAAVGADQWDLPTPCSDWTVRDLSNHVAGEDLWTPPLVTGSTIEEVGDRFDGDVLGADPIAAATQAARAALAATSRALPAGGTVRLSYGEEQLEEYVHQLTADHLIHTWDLAVATGGEDRLDPAVVEHLAAWFTGREELFRGAGIIGPRVQLPDGDPDPQAALLAAFGRDPEWASGPNGPARSNT